MIISKIRKTAFTIADSLIKKGISRSQALHKAWKIAKTSPAERVSQYFKRLTDPFLSVRGNKNLINCLQKLAASGLTFYNKVAKTVLQFGRISAKQARKLANGFFQLERAGLL